MSGKIEVGMSKVMKDPNKTTKHTVRAPDSPVLSFGSEDSPIRSPSRNSVTEAQHLTMNSALAISVIRGDRVPTGALLSNKGINKS